MHLDLDSREFLQKREYDAHHLINIMGSWEPIILSILVFVLKKEHFSGREMNYIFLVTTFGTLSVTHHT